MELTEQNKKEINKLSYLQLLRKWRFAPAGDPWFQGETGTYWKNHMNDMRALPGGNIIHVQSSKALG